MDTRHLQTYTRINEWPNPSFLLFVPPPAHTDIGIARSSAIWRAQGKPRPELIAFATWLVFGLLKAYLSYESRYNCSVLHVALNAGCSNSLASHWLNFSLGGRENPR